MAPRLNGGSLALGPRVGSRAAGRKTPSEPERRAFATRLTHVIEILGWSPKELTERIGREASSERHVEMTRSWMRPHAGRGSKAPPMPELPVILRIAEETGASLDYLLLGLEPMFRSQRPKEEESFEEHFRRVTVEDLSARCGYDPLVVSGLLPDARVLWRIWTGATADGVESQLETEHTAELRTTRGGRLKREEVIASQVTKGIAATTVALNEAREQGLKPLLRVAKQRQAADLKLLKEWISVELERPEPRQHALVFLLKLASHLEAARPTQEQRLSNKLTAALAKLAAGE